MTSEKQLTAMYQKFSYAKGSQHIASEYAIRKLQHLVKKFRIQKVLEVGLGIGSISGILLKLNKKLRYYGTEENSFCLKSLPATIGLEYSRLEIFDSISSLPKDQKYNLIIIDGKDIQLEKVKDLVTPRGVIAIEGDRMAQMEVLSKIFPRNKMVHCISLLKNKFYSTFPSENWQGGLKIIFVDPSKKQFVWWGKERIKTKFKYQYPGRYVGESKKP